jgi:acetoin utilization protein AcuC
MSPALETAERRQWVSDETRARHGLGTVSNPVFPRCSAAPPRRPAPRFWPGSFWRGRRDLPPGGGTHHGFPDRAAGFCYLNDPVLAMLSLRRAGVRRIAYVDIDAHHADGVEHGLAGDPDTLLISVHEDRRWPFHRRAGGGWRRQLS